MKSTAALLVGSAAIALAAASSAYAGGFQRGTADTDILYEKGPVNFRVGTTYVSPKRGFTSINGVSGDFGDYTGDYNLPSVAIEYGTDVFGCAGTFTKSFAAEADYSGSPGGALPPAVAGGSRVQSLEFNSNEFGATCRLSYNANFGRLSLLGGVFAEDFNFNGTSTLNQPLAALAPGVTLAVPGSISVDERGDYKVGYRVGAAYEIPDIALRTQVLYRSEIRHDDIEGTGALLATGAPFLQAGAARLTIQQAVGAGILPAAAAAGLPTDGTTLAAGLPATANTAISPQSLYLNAQTGIAPGWLALGSFRWTDWSTNEEFVTSVAGRPGSVSPYHWRDGYTATLGIGHAFTDDIAGAITLGYDRGVSTGSETTYTDLYTVSGGFSFKGKIGEIRIGGLVGYWTDGEQSISKGAYFDGTVGNDWVYAANASLRIGF